MNLTQKKLDHLVALVGKRKHIYEAQFCVSRPNSTEMLQSTYGPAEANQPFYIASINKLFVAALIFRLMHRGMIKTETPIAAVLPAKYTDGLHVLNGTDYSEKITVGSLLSHTSGLPCYLIDKQPDGSRLMDRLKSGQDIPLPVEKAIELVKLMKPLFPPGTKGKANYANTNYHLLCAVYEEVSKQHVDEALSEIINELGMQNSFVINSKAHRNYLPVRNKDKTLKLDQFFDASKYDIASTADDLMIFIKAYFGGHFFPKSQIAQMQDWNPIFFPFKYGSGVQLFYIPRILSPFQRVPEMIGHCGSVGTVAFFIPEKELFITGTINQSKSLQPAFQCMIRILKEV